MWPIRWTCSFASRPRSGTCPSSGHLEIGTFKGKFTTRQVSPYDCDVYSIVEKQNRPVLISTSRHVRQMAFDIKDLAYDGGQRMLRGVSRAVAGDPYQLRLYVPD